MQETYVFLRQCYQYVLPDIVIFYTSKSTIFLMIPLYMYVYLVIIFVIITMKYFMNINKTKN